MHSRNHEHHESGSDRSGRGQNTAKKNQNEKLTKQRQNQSLLTGTSEGLLVCEQDTSYQHLLHFNKPLWSRTEDAIDCVSVVSHKHAGQILTDVSEVYDQPRHQRQILLLTHKQQQSDSSHSQTSGRLIIRPIISIFLMIIISDFSVRLQTK